MNASIILLQFLTNVGVVLPQLSEGRDHPISFASKTLTSTGLLDVRAHSQCALSTDLISPYYYYQLILLALHSIGPKTDLWGQPRVTFIVTVDWPSINLEWAFFQKAADEGKNVAGDIPLLQSSQDFGPPCAIECSCLSKKIVTAYVVWVMSALSRLPYSCSEYCQIVGGSCSNATVSSNLFIKVSNIFPRTGRRLIGPQLPGSWGSLGPFFWKVFMKACLHVVGTKMGHIKQICQRLDKCFTPLLG